MAMAVLMVISSVAAAGAVFGSAMVMKLLKTAERQSRDLEELREAVSRPAEQAGGGSRGADASDEPYVRQSADAGYAGGEPGAGQVPAFVGEPGAGLESAQTEEPERRLLSTRRSGLDRRALSKGIAGLDMDKAIDRFGGDEDAYLEVLRSFAVNTPPLLAQIEKVDAESLGSYAIIVHGIKGSGHGINADIFADVAETFEKAAKDGNLDFVASHNAAFLGAARKLISDIEALLAEVYVLNPKPVKARPDQGAVDRLLQACKAYNMDGVDMAIGEIGLYVYEDDDGLAEWLQMNVEQMNFAQIIEKLEPAAERQGGEDDG